MSTSGRTDGPVDILIVGAMRSGTTTIARHLGAHPDVHCAAAKEVHYFDRHYDAGPQWYREQLGGRRHQLRLDATPNYMHDPQAIARIGRDAPDAHIIVSLRDPVKRAYSHYWHNVARGKEPLSFAAALAAEPERLAADRLTRAWFSYRDRGFYGRQIAALLDEVDPRLVHLVDFDRYAQDQGRSLLDLCARLGLAPPTAIEPERPRANGYQGFRSLRLRRFGAQLPAPLRRAVGRINRVETSYPPLPTATAEALRAEYAEDQELLARLRRQLAGQEELRNAA